MMASGRSLTFATGRVTCCVEHPVRPAGVAQSLKLAGDKVNEGRLSLRAVKQRFDLHAWSVLMTLNFWLMLRSLKFVFHHRPH